MEIQIVGIDHTVLSLVLQEKFKNWEIATPMT